MGLFKQPIADAAVEKNTSKPYRPLAFAALKDDELGAIYNIAPIKRLEEGAVIVEAEAQQDSCYGILSGSFRLLLPAKGSVSTLATLGRGEWFGRVGTPETLPYTVIAAEPSTVMHISSAVMQQLPAKAQTAISAALSTPILRGFRVLAEGAGQDTQKIEVLTKYTNAVAESRMTLTKAFIDRYLSEIPKLPQHANDLAMKLLSERTTPQEVAEGVKRDPALAALVLQTVNSAYYGLRTQVSDYYRACLLLGFNNIYRLVLDKSIQGIMPHTEESRAIQEHSYVVSVFAHEIARLSGKVAPPLAVTVGLLHDVGKSVLLLFKQRHPELATSFDLLDPSAVGAGVLASWKLPTDIVKIVEEQSRFAYAPPDQMPQECRHAIAALYLAHGCCDLLTENVNEVTPGIFTDEYLADLGFPNSSLKDFYLKKVQPVIVKEQKCLPEPIRKILSLENGDEQTI